jgi:hypothetical protein
VLKKKKHKSQYHWYIDFGDLVLRGRGQAHFVPNVKMKNVTIFSKPRGIQALFSFNITAGKVQGRLMACSCPPCIVHDYSNCNQMHIVGPMMDIKLTFPSITAAPTARAGGAEAAASNPLLEEPPSSGLASNPEALETEGGGAEEGEEDEEDEEEEEEEEDVDEEENEEDEVNPLEELKASLAPDSVFVYRDDKEVFNLVKVTAVPSEGEARPDDEVFVDVYSRRDVQGLEWGCTKGHDRTVRLEGFAFEVVVKPLVSKRGRNVAGLQLSEEECTRVYERLREEEECIVGIEEAEDAEEKVETEVEQQGELKRKCDTVVERTDKKSRKSLNF